MILVRAFTRVHVGLIDMGGATARRHGGAGFMLKQPTIEVSARCGAGSVTGLSVLDVHAQSDVRQLLKRIRADSRFPPASVTIRRSPRQHIGLGTKTALLLAILKAHELLGDQRVPQHELQRLSGRGGVSGIGIHGFFHGGFIVDGGHAVAEDSEYAPSSCRRCFNIPPLNARADIPTDWRFLLCCPPGKRYSGNMERAFFNRNSPISRAEVHDTIADVYHGLLPAVLERDLLKLKDAMQHIHGCGFKRRELNNQSVSAQSLFQSLSRISNCAVGMSSMGPLLFAIVQADDVRALHDVQRKAQQAGAEVLAVSPGRNVGFEVA